MQESFSLKNVQLVVLYLLPINARILENNLWSKYFTCNVVFNLQANAMKINRINALDFMNQKPLKWSIISKINFPIRKQKIIHRSVIILKFLCGNSFAGWDSTWELAYVIRYLHVITWNKFILDHNLLLQSINPSLKHSKNSTRLFRDFTTNGY